MIKAILTTLIFATLPAFGGGLSIPLTNEPIIATPKRIYRCEQGYDPPCRLVTSEPVNPEVTDWAELLAAARAYRSGIETPVLEGSGPIEVCATSHGSGGNCCKVVARVNGITYIQCG